MDAELRKRKRLRSGLWNGGAGFSRKAEGVYLNKSLRKATTASPATRLEVVVHADLDAVQVERSTRNAAHDDAWEVVGLALEAAVEVLGLD
jgi:hypothetical protein